jgi:thiol-disulfide isomerase/thioredoxin
LESKLQGEEEDDADYELRMLRDARLKEMKKTHKEKVENIGKGHGQYREIAQDEFLAEVTGSARVICHFYHNDFPRCKIMDHHIQKLVGRHIETKFVKINAEKAPFFVEKVRRQQCHIGLSRLISCICLCQLSIRTIPTLLLFFDGVAKGKILGFEGLTDDMPAGKEDEWPTIKLARLLASGGAIDEDVVVDDDQIEQQNKATLEEMRSKVIQQAMNFDLDDDDLLLDDE